MMFHASFNSISVISWRQLTLFMSFLGFTSTRLGSEVFCQRTLPQKKKKKKNRGSSAARTQDPWIRVKQFATEPRRTRKDIDGKLPKSLDSTNGWVSARLS